MTNRIFAAVTLVVLVAFLIGLTRTGGFDTLTQFLNSLTSEGFNALRGV